MIQSTPELAITEVPRDPLVAPFSLGAVGDVMLLRPMLATLRATRPELVDRLTAPDLLFGNLETSLIDLEAFTGSPAAESGGSWLHGPPSVATDLHGLGFTLMSFANNHAADWGTEGLRDTLAAARQAGLTIAGAGSSLSAAQAPQYVDTPHGRVALVAATTTFTAQSRAADPLGRVPGRSGVSAVRSTPVGRVPRHVYDELRSLAAANPAFLNEVGDDHVRFLGARFEPDDDGSGPALAFRSDASDVADVLRSVRQGRENSNFVIFSLHSHEPTNDSEAPADFAADLARSAVDAGADVVIGHGPHQLRGVEIYRGVPILHSLGDFAMMSNSMDVAPRDTWDFCRTLPGSATVPGMLTARNEQIFTSPNVLESALATISFDAEGWELVIHPLDLGRSRSGAGRGVPDLARGPAAARILQRLQRLSADRGTTLVIGEETATVRCRLAASAACHDGSSARFDPGATTKKVQGAAERR